MSKDENNTPADYKRRSRRRTFWGITFFLFIAGIAYLLFTQILTIKRGDPNSVYLVVKNQDGVPTFKVQNGLIMTYFLNSVYEYPLNLQTYYLAKSDSFDRGVYFVTEDGISMRADLFVEAGVIKEHIPELFNFFGKSLDNCFYKHIANDIKSSFIVEAGNYTADSIINNQNLFINSVAKKIIQQYSSKYINISNIGLTTPISLPKELMKQINESVFQKQFAIEAKFKKERAEAEAASSIALNKMHLDSVITSNKIKLYNQMVNNELRINQYKTDSTIYALEYTKAKLQYIDLKNMEKAIDKWDGHLPENTGKLKLPFKVDVE